MNQTKETEFTLKAVKVGRKAKSSDSWLFKNLSFCVQGGDRISLTGDTGSGKTLLLRALAFLDPIDVGELFWLNNLVTDIYVPEFRSRVIYLPQKPSMFGGTVEDNLKMPFQFDVYKDRSYDQNRVLEFLVKLGRDSEFLTKQTSKLSGGEMQIASLVRSMQLNPQLVMLDEPTASLDSKTTKLVETAVIEWFNELQEERSFIWITHSNEQANRVSNRKFHLVKGHLEEVSA